MYVQASKYDTAQKKKVDTDGQYHNTLRQNFVYYCYSVSNDTFAQYLHTVRQYKYTVKAQY